MTGKSKGRKILFVDDEQALLNGISRRLGFVYDLETAISGEEALDKMETEGPFAVIVTDMRMPKMDGIQFIQRARMISREATYIMLTGNQDQETAISAMNEGQVFRFLNKPCDANELKKAIEVGIKQYELVISEKELLHQTFLGGVSVLTEVLEISQPEIFGLSTEIEQVFTLLRESINAPNRWEYKLANKLVLVGFALLPREDRQRIGEAVPFDPEDDELFDKAVQISSRLIEHIPRLEIVAKIILEQSKTDGSVQSTHARPEDRLIRVGGTMLCTALYWCCLKKLGLNSAAAMNTLLRRLPNLCPQFTEALQQLPDEVENRPSITLHLGELAEGMVISEDIVTHDDARLLRKGQRVSQATLEKLQMYLEKNVLPEEYHVYESSCAWARVPAGIA